MVNLASLTYRPRVTNLALGTCSTVDFVVLLLAEHGSLPVRSIYARLAAWRGGFLSPNGQYTPATHLFSGEFFYVSRSETDLAPAFSNPGYKFGTNKTTLWYRVSHGVYALNANGLARLARIIKKQ
jgi:hypothetical protein